MLTAILESQQSEHFFILDLFFINVPLSYLMFIKQSATGEASKPFLIRCVS